MVRRIKRTTSIEDSGSLDFNDYPGRHFALLINVLTSVSTRFDPITDRNYTLSEIYLKCKRCRFACERDAGLVTQFNLPRFSGNTNETLALPNTFQFIQDISTRLHFFFNCLQTSNECFMSFQQFFLKNRGFTPKIL